MSAADKKKRLESDQPQKVMRRCKSDEGLVSLGEMSGGKSGSSSSSSGKHRKSISHHHSSSGSGSHGSSTSSKRGTGESSSSASKVDGRKSERKDRKKRLSSKKSSTGSTKSTTVDAAESSAASVASTTSSSSSSNGSPSSKKENRRHRRSDATHPKKMRRSSSLNSVADVSPSFPIYHVNTVAAVKDIIFEKDDPIGLDFEISEGVEKMLILNWINKDIHKSLNLGDRIVYVAGQTIDESLLGSLEKIWDLIEHSERPFSIGVETVFQKKSNLKRISEEEELRRLATKTLFPKYDDDEEESGGRRQGGDGKKISRKRKPARRCIIVDPKGRKQADDDEFAIRRPPIRFSRSWEWLMTLREFEKDDEDKSSKSKKSKKKMVWVADDVSGWVLGQVQNCFRTSVRVSIQHTQEVKTVALDKIKVYSSASVSLEDISQLSLLNEASVLSHFRKRFETVDAENHHQHLSTWCSTDVLFTFNPFEEVSHAPAAKLSKDVAHPVNLANQAYESMKKQKKCQAIILTGVSGSGKSRLVMDISNHILDTKPLAKGSRDTLRAKLASCDILLQAFGNASTVRGADSTCFSKVTQLIFDQDAKMYDIKFQRHLFELDRVVWRSRYERNFHIFYQVYNGWQQLVNGANFTISKDLGLDPNQQGVELELLGPDSLVYRKLTRPHDTKSSRFPLTSKDGLQHTLQAMELIGMDEYVREDILRILAALIHLGNVHFVKTEESGGVAVTGTGVSKSLVSAESMDSFLKACDLLEINEEQLMESFLFKKRSNQLKRRTPIPLSTRHAASMRDHFIKHVYELLFDLIMQTMNDSLHGEVQTDGAKEKEDQSEYEDCRHNVLNLVEFGGFAYPLKTSPSYGTKRKNNSGGGGSSSSSNGNETPTKKVVRFSHNMQYASQPSPLKFSKSNMLSLDGLFQNFASEVLEQMFQKVVMENELQLAGADMDSRGKQDLRKMLRSSLRQQKVIQLFIGHPEGVLPFLDQQSLLRGLRPDKDSEFVQQLSNLQEKNKLFQRAMFGYQSFQIKHYSGKMLEYDARGMVSENVRLISCTTQFLNVFDASISPVLALLNPLAQIQHHNESFEEEKLNQHSTAKTLSQQKRRGIAALSEVIERCDLSFIRCMVPNLEGQAKCFDGAVVNQQLSYLGIRQLNLIKRNLYPTSMSMDTIVSKFYPIARVFKADVEKDAIAIIKVILGKDSQNRLWQLRKGKENASIIYFSLVGQRAMDRCRWRLREKSTLRLQYAFMIHLERICCAKIIQHFVQRTILHPSRSTRAANVIINAFRMFQVRNDFLTVRNAAIRIQSIIRVFLCRSWDMNIINKAVIPIQRLWRGQAVRYRLKVINVCRRNTMDFLGKNQCILRSSLVLQMSGDAIIGRSSKRKRQLLLTSEPKPEIKCIDPVTRKLLWSIPWDGDTTVARKMDDETRDATYFQLQARLKEELKTVSFIDLLDTQDNVGWARDINRPSSIAELLKLPFPLLIDRFFSSFFLSGPMHRRSLKNSKVYKERFYLLHRGKLFCFKGEIISHVIKINEETTVKSMNFVDGVEHNYVEVSYKNQDGEDAVLMLRSPHREVRDRWVQGFAWVIGFCHAKQRLETLKNERVRRTSLVRHVQAIETLRNRGHMVHHRRVQSVELTSQRRPESVQRRLSKLLSGTQKKSLSLNLTGLSFSLEDGAEENVDGRQRSRSSSALLKGAPLASPVSVGSPGFRSPSSLRMPVVGLYHRMSETSYQCKSQRDLEKERTNERCRRVSQAKLAVGKVDEAWNHFCENALFKDRVLDYPLLEREVHENQLLVFSEMQGKRESRRRSKRKHRRELADSAAQGHDEEALEDATIFEVLEALKLTQYHDNFKESGCETILQAKSLCHDDLADFGIDSFAHQEILITAFQNYARIGSSLSQPKRNSLRVAVLLQQGEESETDDQKKKGDSKSSSSSSSPSSSGGGGSASSSSSSTSGAARKSGDGSGHGNPAEEFDEDTDAEEDDNDEEDPEFQEKLEKIGLGQYHQVLLDNKLKNLKSLRNIKLKRMNSKLGDEDLEVIKTAVENGSDIIEDDVNEEGEEENDDDSKEASNKLLKSSDSSSRKGVNGNTRADEEMEAKKHVNREDSVDSTTSSQSDGSGKKLRKRISFADQVDWKCKVCSNMNHWEESKCSKCGGSAKPSSERLEQVCVLESCNPWKCTVCSSVNAYTVVFCPLCNNNRFEQPKRPGEENGKYMLDEDEILFQMGNRVKLINNFDKYKMPKNSGGLVIEVYYDRPQCQIQFDDGSIKKVDNSDLRKPGRLIPPISLSSIFKLPSTLSPSSRFRSGFHH